RHTRFSRDWSSDVCSSDLLAGMVVSAFALTDGDPLSLMRALTPIFDFEPRGNGAEEPIAVTFAPQDGTTEPAEPVETQAAPVVRSEERRGGRECRDGREEC